MAIELERAHEFIAKFAFNYFSVICSLPVRFSWEDGHAYLKKVKGFPMLVWYIREFCTYIQFPAAVIYVYWQWDNYQDNPNPEQLSQIVINGFFASGALFCCTLQFVFHQNRKQIISLVNNTINLTKHFEQSKLIPLFMYLQ